MRNGILAALILWLAGTMAARAQTTNAFDEAPPEAPPEASAGTGPNAWVEPVAPSENAFNGQPPCPPPPTHFWVRPEYVFWMLKADQTPPLVTTAPPSPNFALGAGILNVPGTRTLYGGSNPDLNLSGGRIDAGFWCDDCHHYGVEANYFALETGSKNFAVASDPVTGLPVLSRPVIDTQTVSETILSVSFPGQFAGTININHSTRFEGAEVNALFDLAFLEWEYKTPAFLVGVRYLRLDDVLGINQTTGILAQGTSGFAGTIVGPSDLLQINDSFATKNRFYGGQFGFRWEQDFNHILFVNVLAKLAVGVTHQESRINGSTTDVSAAGTATTVEGGLLALSSNIGTLSRDDVSVVPEVGVNVGAHVFHNVRVNVGYSFLYWSSVVRAGEQVDRAINPTLLPTSFQFGTASGPARPAATFNQTDFFVHGVNAGLEIDF